MMSEIAGELARVRSAFEQPTLTLLHQRQAPVRHRGLPGRVRPRQQADPDRAPARPGRGPPRASCGWPGRRTSRPAPAGTCASGGCAASGWCARSTTTGQEVYALTSHAQQALELVKTLARDRATLSEHRIATILNTVRRFNSEANPDRTARVTILDAEIARLSAERDRLVDGEEMSRCRRGLHARGVHRAPAARSPRCRATSPAWRSASPRSAAEILASFRAEDRPAGEVIDDYLARADSLMTATAEGRAFEGAFALLRDDAMVAQLREDLTALLDHPLSDGLLADADRAELRGTVRLIRDGPRPGALPALPGHRRRSRTTSSPTTPPATASWSRPCARSSPS